MKNRIISPSLLAANFTRLSDDVKKVEDLTKISSRYDNNSQSFEIYFNYRKNTRVTIPITCRTRAAGGWAGKSLYMTTQGLIVKKMN